MASNADYSKVTFGPTGSWNIYKDSISGKVNDVNSWVEEYKHAFINQNHDESQLNLILPDDCLVLIGPPRLKDAQDTSGMYAVGFLNQISYTETRNVQPLKAIGSRRHIFAATNNPVQGTIMRLMFIGDNLLRALSKSQSIPDSIAKNVNSTYYDGKLFNENASNGEVGEWFSNIEEDLFRVPFGMGVIYNSPSSLASSNSKFDAGKGVAEYIEGCVLLNRTMSLQSGQAMVMEQVTFMADRVVGWSSWNGNN